ncbi:MAG: DUF2892 domain-containing protein [Candidatus ainarchaeum sp.]|nr:DUF2892 domain-containing protein [Candidatus ainarchaeum sp.]MDD5096441.1 DUF2892 domain-containing protein [Candidatus ainarchaeum sp.]
MKFFEKNVGNLDRAVRVVLGLALLYYSFISLLPPLIYAGIIVAAILLFTGLMGTCALYSFLGMDTLRKK